MSITWEKNPAAEEHSLQPLPFHQTVRGQRFCNTLLAAIARLEAKRARLAAPQEATPQADRSHQTIYQIA